MAVQKLRIADGVTLNVITTDKFKNCRFSVNLIAPLKRETASANALILPTLVRGSVKYPTMGELNKRLNDLYGASIGTICKKMGEYQILGFDAGVLEEKFIPEKSVDVFGGVLEVLQDLLFHPLLENGVFRTEYVESEKRNLQDYIRSKINNLTSYAIFQGQASACAEEAYAVDQYGQEEDVASITPSSLFARYQALLEQSEMQLFYVGRKKAEEIAEIAKRLTQGCPRAKIVRGETVVKRTVSEVKNVTCEMPVEQGKLTLVFRSGKVLQDGDYQKMSLTNEILGGSPTSKLFMNVREKLSLCYYCSSFPEPLKGILTVASGVETAKKETAQKAILAQLAAVANGDFTEEEITNAKISICNSYEELQDSPRGLESWYLVRLLAGLSSSPEEAKAQIMDLTKEDIVQTAKNIVLDTVYFLKGTKGATENG